MSEKIPSPAVLVSENRIVRSGKTNGIATPAFINNGGYYAFVELEIFSDGIVDCWELVDFPWYARKLSQGWVSTHVPDGKTFSVFHCGSYTISNAQWFHDPNSFYRHSISLLRALNPELTDLYELRNGSIWTRGGIEDQTIQRSTRDILVEQTGLDTFQHHPGESQNLFFRWDDGSYYLGTVSVFANGTLRFNHLPEVRMGQIEELEYLASSGQITTSPPEESTIEIRNLGRLKLRNHRGVPMDQKLSEIKEVHRELNGLPTPLETARELFDAFCKAPSAELKHKLKEAYEAIPEHKRRYVGDMDTKDTAVRMVIYGNKEMENWSHYQVAKLFGLDLPSIKVPDLPEEP